MRAERYDSRGLTSKVYDIDVSSFHSGRGNERVHLYLKPEGGGQAIRLAMDLEDWKALVAKAAAS